MTYATWEAIAETPWWIYFMIFVLMLMSYQATKPRYIHLKPELALQVISFALFSTIVCYYVSFSLNHISLIVASSVMGYVLGWTHFRIRKIQAVIGHYTVYVPGSLFPFCIIPCLIAAKYWYFGNSYTIDIDLLHTPIYQNYLSILFGFSLGLFFGRITILLQRLRMGPFIESPKSMSS